MNKMGGLWRKIPITHWTMLIGTIAIAGIPPLAGFFSKDEILGQTWFFGFNFLFVIGWIVAGMTAFYMWRLMGKTFYGKSRVDPHVEPKIHESPWTMWVPLVLLAIPSIFLGMALGLPFGSSTIEHWLEPVFFQAQEQLGRVVPTFEFFGMHGALILASTGIAAVGLGLGIWLFGIFRRDGKDEKVAAMTARVPSLYRGSFNKWYFDDLNHLLFVELGGKIANSAAWFDKAVVDGIVNGVASVTQRSGDRLRTIQTGRVQNYALGIATGLIVIAVAVIFVVTR